MILALLFLLAADDAPMRATLVDGMVTMNGGPLAEGDPLREGDTVQTLPGSHAEITMPSGTVLRLGENTRLTLGATAPGKAFSAKLFLGNLWAKVHKLIAGETFHVETENAVAGVRGTEFRVEVAPGQEDLLRVYEGAVEVKARDGSWTHRIAPGNEVRFAKDHATPRAFDAASEKEHKFMKWVRERPAREGTERLRHLERKERKKR
jgi:hypothetical protein